MPISPLYVGSTHFPMSVTWSKDDGSPVDLTSATVTVRFSPDQGNPNPAFTGGGTVAITDAPNGKFTYPFVTADLANPGSWHLQFVATYGAGNLELSDTIPLVILAAL